MSNHKSIIKKVADSITNFFNAYHDKEKFENNDHSIPGTRRVLPPEFDSIGQTSHKRPKLHHDLFNLPASRLVKPEPEITNTVNDGGSEISEHSNASISTSGVSSLNPKSRKVEQLNERPMKLRTFDQCTFDSSKNSSYLSSSSKRILEKLSKLSTPILCADKLKYPMRPSVNSRTKPYSRPIPKLETKRVMPMKVVTVSASSDEIKRKVQPKLKSYGFSDNVDLDDIEEISSSNAKLSANKPINLNLPLLTKSVSTNTDINEITVHKKNSKDIISFDFSVPKHNYDSDAVSELTEDEVHDTTPKFEIKSILTPKVIGFPKMELIQKGWRCETCFTENENDNKLCIQCEEVAKAKKSKNVIIKPLISDNNEDQIKKLQQTIESKQENHQSELSHNVFKASETVPNSIDKKLSDIPAQFSFGEKQVEKHTVTSDPIVNSSIKSDNTKVETTFTFGSSSKNSIISDKNAELSQNSVLKTNTINAKNNSENISKPVFTFTPNNPVDSKKVETSSKPMFNYSSSNASSFEPKNTVASSKPLFQFSNTDQSSKVLKTQSQTEQPFYLSSSKLNPGLPNSSSSFQFPFNAPAKNSQPQLGNMFSHSSIGSEAPMLCGSNSTSNNPGTLLSTTNQKKQPVLSNMGLFNFGNSSIKDNNLQPSNDSTTINFGSGAKTPTNTTFQFGASNSGNANGPFVYNSNSQSAGSGTVNPFCCANPQRRITKARRRGR